MGRNIYTVLIWYVIYGTCYLYNDILVRNIWDVIFIVLIWYVIYGTCYLYNDILVR